MSGSDKPAILAVIIPAYNAEKTLARTAKSVLNQTFRLLEVWIVDDGSTDGTLEVAESLRSVDPRVYVLHQENAGAYAARLYALKRIKAKWVSFVDADDLISPELYASVIDFAESNALEIVQYDEPDAPESLVPFEIFNGRDEILQKIIRPRLAFGNGAMLMWDKIYLNLYDYESFPQYSGVTQFDDHIFNLVFFMPVKRVGYFHRKMYDYRPNPATASKRYARRSLRGLLLAIEARKRYLPLFCISNAEMGCRLWLEKNMFNIFCRAAFSRPCPIAEAVSNLREIESTDAFRECMSNGCTWRVKVMGICVKIPRTMVVLFARIIHNARDLLLKGF